MNNSVPIRLRRTGKTILNKSVSAIRRNNKKQEKMNVVEKTITDWLHWGLCLIAFVGIGGIILLSFVLTAQAQCLQADAAMKRSGIVAAEKLYEACALNENDETAQLFLAKYYQNKAIPSTQDKMKMLFYYHLAAENGNADGQVALARVLMKMDETEKDRAILITYMDQMNDMMKNKGAHFIGEMLHPYALLMLAAEDETQKWYYPTTQKKNAQARALLAKYEISSDKKSMVIRQAGKWKQQKMKETAQEVLPYVEYQKFMETVYPEKGRADAFERQQAVDRLKEKVEQYLQ